VLGSDYEVIFASSGNEAISILATDPEIDVILMDIQMPVKDGFQTASEIRAMPSAKDIPIIFITAVYKEDPFVKRGYQVGGIDYFGKPFDPDILKLKLSIYSSFRHRTKLIRSRERQLEETEELLRVGRKLSGILENLPVGVLIADVEGRVCQINEQVARICDSQPQAHPGAYGEMLGWWDEEGRMIVRSGPLLKALQEGVATHSESIQITCKGGVTKKILCSASPLLGLDGHIVGAVVVLQDITESKEIEAALEERITRVIATGVEIEESITH
jgi:PAS domain S-box-containing protein